MITRSDVFLVAAAFVLVPVATVVIYRRLVRWWFKDGAR